MNVLFHTLTHKTIGKNMGTQLLMEISILVKHNGFPHEIAEVLVNLLMVGVYFTGFRWIPQYNL